MMKANVILSAEDKDMIRRQLADLKENTRFCQSKEHIQHGTTSVYWHCISVACVSVWIARKWRAKVHDEELIRGALLHDYFLYDWHDQKPSRRLHGFYHPRIAFENARKDVALSKREEDIIVKHMFPLTILPPMYLESAIVCIADKICSTWETADGLKKRLF